MSDVLAAACIALLRAEGVRLTEGLSSEELARTERRFFSHRYIPAAPAPSRAPVFSVHQADVGYYGADFHDYLLREFGDRRGHVEGVAHPVQPWSSLAMGFDDSDL